MRTTIEIDRDIDSVQRIKIEASRRLAKLYLELREVQLYVK